MIDKIPRSAIIGHVGSSHPVGVGWQDVLLMMTCIDLRCIFTPRANKVSLSTNLRAPFGLHTMLAPATLAILVPLLLLTHSLYNYIRSPLRKIPAAHPLSHLTSLWIHSIRWRSMENGTLKAAHDRLGPIVCLGPNEISLNCVKGGIREVYAGGFEKESSAARGYNWYSFFSNYGGYVVRTLDTSWSRR
jgi:hypothetical protein